MVVKLKITLELKCRKKYYLMFSVSQIEYIRIKSGYMSTEQKAFCNIFVLSNKYRGFLIYMVF